MKTKSLVVALLSLLMFSGVLMTTVSANSWPNLPPTTSPVTLEITDTTPCAYPFVIALSNVPGGFDVSDGTYDGWCVDLTYGIERGEEYQVVLYSSLSPPSEAASIPLDMVNYILNNKQGSGVDVQWAIWYFVNGGVFPTTIPPLPYCWPVTVPTADATAMVNDAELNGAGYIPGEGDILSIICLPEDPDGAGEEERAQMLIIELTVPPELTPGFTPGFWKHDIKVRLGLTKGHYNAFKGGPLDGVKLTDEMMDSFLDDINDMLATSYTFEQLLGYLQLRGWDPLRTNTANWFNDVAGYGPYED